MRNSISPSLIDRVESRLLMLAAVFMFLYSAALTISPAVRARSWDVSYRWDHWLGVLLWSGSFYLAHRQSTRWLSGRDPYLLPIVALLSGWGMLTIWRLMPEFGIRQSIWLVIASGIFIAGLRMPNDLAFLRRYKYLWLTGSLLLTALTLLFGTNPQGYGPRMWLGCCGIYLQPSEPLKLMLIAYLAAYFADRQTDLVLSIDELSKQVKKEKASALFSWQALLLPLLAPTLIMTGLALALLMIQRDLGTAFIFMFLYAAVVYVTSGRRSILIVAFLTLVLTGVLGYWLFDVVRVRVDAWLNPWLDPSGRSFQIVQSVLAMANGGLFGRGPGVGNPGVVPVAHSDLVYAAIVEEHGLIGAIGLLLLIALLASRGIRAAFNAPDAYRRYLASGMIAYLVGQSLLIIGGNLRLFPLTGVTLTLVSYGGSSLVTSFIAVLLLVHISNRREKTPSAVRQPRPYLQLGGFLLVGLAAAAFATGWWAIYRGPALLTRTDNPRRAIEDRAVRRGAILDRNNRPINTTSGVPGEYERRILYPNLSNIVGYTHPKYGQSGLEASLDETLRGLEGNPGRTIWWNHLLYGQPPPGLDVRLSLDLDLQEAADRLLGEHPGAVVLLDATRGEILAMASHPTFNANRLGEDWEKLISDPKSPLLNRVVLGQYDTGRLETSLFSPGYTQGELSQVPKIRLPSDENPQSGGNTSRLSPLQVALAAASISNRGTRPAAKLVTAVNTPQAGWVILPALEEPRQVFSAGEVERIAEDLAVEGTDFWQIVQVIPGEESQGLTWYVGGTQASWSGTPYVAVVLLEEEEPGLAEQIGRGILASAMGK